MKLKEITNLGFGIFGRITIQDVSLTIDQGMFQYYENIENAIKNNGEAELIQIYGFDNGITFVIYSKTILDHPVHH